MILQDAFTKGIAAAENAAANKKEILSVLKDLSDVLQNYLEVDCSVELEREERFKPGTLTFINTGWDWVTLSIAQQSPQQLFKIKISEDGYPVVVSYQEMDESAFDKSSFESSISEVISDTAFGKKLFRIKLSIE